jgi:hypothetical protein
MDARTVVLPTMHADQARAWRMPGRFKCIRCGRRWGKTTYGAIIACDDAVNGLLHGWFAPDYRRLAVAYNMALEWLAPLIVRASRNEGVIKLTGGGGIDFWTLEDENAGRSRKYHRVTGDEIAFAKNETMMGVWQKAIRPTLLDYRGGANMLSNTNGDDSENFFWKICNEKNEDGSNKHGFVEYHAPSSASPLLSAEEIAELRAMYPPLVFAQEYEALFVNWAGVAFFALDKMLVDGLPVPYPTICDTVFAIVDTASKTGTANDGTAVCYFATTKIIGIPLVILDWDIAQIEGASLNTWLPAVFRRCEELAKACRARFGTIGALIEDAASGIVLLQHAKSSGWPANAIESKLTALGKDGRAIDASKYVHSGQVKLSDYAYNKVTTYKEETRNHLITQVTRYRVGDKDNARRADDLLDTFTYGIATALGNPEGF